MIRPYQKTAPALNQFHPQLFVMSAPSKSIPRAIGFAIVIATISVAGWFFFIKGPPASAHHFYVLA